VDSFGAATSATRQTLNLGLAPREKRGAAITPAPISLWPYAPFARGLWKDSLA